MVPVGTVQVGCTTVTPGAGGGEGGVRMTAVEGVEMQPSLFFEVTG